MFFPKITITYVVVSSSVVSNAHVPPEVVEADGGKDNVGIVDLMVLGNPGSNESPHGFPGGVSSDSGNLLWSSSY